MKLIGIVNTLLSVNVPNLNTKKYGDVYDILNNETIDYCAMVVEALRTEIRENMEYVTLRLTVVDRLLSDDTNLLNVFDNCSKILGDILNGTPDDIDYEENYTIEYIKQDFADHLAGCYAEVTFITPTNYCLNYE